MVKELVIWFSLGLFVAGCGRSGESYEPQVYSKELLRKAEAGDAKAQLQLGGAYQEGRGVETNPTLAMEWIQKSADQGYPRGLAILGQCYLLGQGVNRDETKALLYMTQAAERGYAEAQFNLAAFLTKRKNYAEAFSWMKSSAQRGFPEGQYALGRLYERGQGCERNQEQAIRWYKKAAESGNLKAASKLGFLYRNGMGVERDASEAIRWFQRATELGDTNALIAAKHVQKELEFEKSLTEDKRKMLRKIQQELGQRLGEIENEQQLPKPDASHYEVLSSISKENQRFYVEEILLSEDESLIGIFSADMRLDPTGEWALGPITTKFVRIEDLKNQEKNYRFKLVPSRGRGELIQTSEAGRKKEHSRFMKDLFEQYGKPNAETTYGDWEYKILENEITITRYAGNEAHVVVPKEINGIPVKKIGMAFKEFGELRAVTIPDGVAEIGFWAFSGCTNLVSVKLGKDLKKIGGYAFSRCSTLSEIIFPEGLEQIGEEAFSGCAGLKHLSLPNSVRELGFSAFFKCTGLEGVTIGNGVKNIPDYLFYGCSNLCEVQLPEGLVNIGQAAFQYCGNLSKVTVPISVKSIAWGAFDHSPKLSQESLQQIRAVEGVRAEKAK